VGIPPEFCLVLCGGQQPIFTTKKYKVAASATNQYSRHAACENGQLGGDQGTGTASARSGNGIGYHYNPVTEPFSTSIFWLCWLCLMAGCAWHSDLAVTEPPWLLLNPWWP